MRVASQLARSDWLKNGASTTIDCDLSTLVSEPIIEPGAPVYSTLNPAANINRNIPQALDKAGKINHAPREMKDSPQAGPSLIIARLQYIEP